MRQRILKSIYNLLYWIDSKRKWIRNYSYETAPYCGHYYSGHKGKLTLSDYHEGDGEKRTRTFFGLSIVYHTEEGWFIGKE